jgi:hypothetical protein
MVDQLDGIKENFDFTETTSKIPDTGSEESYDNINNYSEEDFTTRYGKSPIALKKSGFQAWNSMKTSQ